MKIQIPLIVILLLIAVPHQSVMAGKPDLIGNSPRKSDTGVSKTELESNAAKTDYSAFKKGVSFQSGSETYQFLPELYSVNAKKLSSRSSTGLLGSISNEKAAILVKEKGPFKIYQSGLTVENLTMSSQNLFAETLYPVVLNNRTGNLAIVTGLLAVKLIDINEADNIAKEFNLAINRKFSHINTVFYVSGPDQDIIRLNQNLDDDSRIESATIDVLEHLQVAW